MSSSSFTLLGGVKGAESIKSRVLCFPGSECGATLDSPPRNPLIINGPFPLTIKDGSNSQGSPYELNAEIISKVSNRIIDTITVTSFRCKFIDDGLATISSKFLKDLAKISSTYNYSRITFTKSNKETHDIGY